MDAKLSGDRSQGQPLLPQVEGPSLLPGPAKLSPFGLSSPDTGDYPIADQVALELSDRGEYVEQESPGRSRGGDRLVQYHEVHTERLELLAQSD